MAKKGTKAYDVAIKHGDKPLETSTALRSLAEVMRGVPLGVSSGSYAQYTVVDADWAGRCIWRDLPIVRSIKPREVSIETGEASEAGEYDAVESFLRARLSTWDPKALLLDLGMDSLDEG